MSNSIDFFQSEESNLALPAATVSIETGGRLCSILEPVKIIRGGWDEFSLARLRYNPALDTESEPIAVEDIESEFPMGESVCIRQYYNGAAPGSATFGLTIFYGRIEGIETTIGPRGPSAEIVARDFSSQAERITVYGRRAAAEDGSSVLLASLDTVFNPDGQGNANPAPIQTGGQSYTIFCAEPSNGMAWTYAQVIEYLLNEYIVGADLLLPERGRLAALTDKRVARDLDVTGLSLLEALHRCCERIGLRFKFVPRLAETGPREAIVFYRSGAGRAVELNYQLEGERLSISKTNILSLSSIRNLWPVTHRYIGQGDFKVYEASFDLVKAWDPGLEGTNYDTFSPSTNSFFYQVKDVYRKWCLNEAGDYTDEPYNQGDAFDFLKIFEGSSFAHGRRRFRPALSADKQGRSLGYYLEVSYDGGTNWWQYMYAFNNLLDECGIWLSSDQLDMNTWVAALKGVLKFRITASVVADERVSCTVADGPVKSTVPVVDHLITLPRQFKYRKVSGSSIFSGGANEGLGKADAVDDTNALYEYIRHKAEGSGEIIERTDVQTPWLEYDFRVGDRISTSPDSRDLLSVWSDNRSMSTIERVRMDFVGQCTNLKIVRKRGRH
ncbi:MAG: hypothetical protein ACYS8Z_02420 [Planctomycetota bacterium]